MTYNRFASKPMKRLVFALFVLTASAAPSWAAGLTLSIRDGLVSLDAQDVTVRQILTEWARVGKTNIINVERITGGPITLKIDAMPEKQALEIILRTIPGYMALPRETRVADASVYDRILIMATTATVAPLRSQPTPTFPGTQSGMPGGAGGTFTRLGPNGTTPMSPGVLPDQADQMDDPAIAAAAAAGLIPVPAPYPGPVMPSGTPMMPPLMPPPGTAPPQPAATPNAPGTGAPTNPWNAPVGTAQPSLAPPPTTLQPPPISRVRPPQADR
jgi:hypothetical protein